MKTTSMLVLGLTAAAVGVALYLRADAEPDVAATVTPHASERPQLVELDSDQYAS